MTQVRVNIYNIITNIIVEEGDEDDIPVINNVFAKQKT